MGPNAGDCPDVIIDREGTLGVAAGFEAEDGGRRVRAVLRGCDPERRAVEVHPARMMLGAIADGHALDQAAVGVDAEDEPLPAVDVDGGHPPCRVDVRHPLRMVDVGAHG
jgi:hypothetical protein